jgi:hypothetical protein
MTVTTDEQGKKNLFAREPKMYVDPNTDFSVTHNEKAEMLNGRVAMISIMLAFVSYFTTGTLAFGLF